MSYSSSLTYSLTYHPVNSGDNSFLLALYSSTRLSELEAWGWNCQQKEAFLKMQFEAQQIFYQTNFPEGKHQLILANSLPIGAIFVVSNESEICLLDMALLPAYQNRGIGTQLMQELIRKATEEAKLLRLQVLKFNPAIRFYQRLGMKIRETTETHWLMEI